MPKPPSRPPDGDLRSDQYVMSGSRKPRNDARLAYVEVFVYEWPVRLWHWVNALCVLVLVGSGLLIASPVWPSLAGEASDHFLMGHIRFAHFAAGYVFAVAFCARGYWALVGNRWARELFFIPVTSRRWWAELWWQCRWYAFQVPAARPHVGHDPLAQLVMFALFTIPSIFMIVTGLALYGEGWGRDSWQDALFGWITPLLGQSQGMHTWHHLGMWVLIIFTIVHVYAALREELMSGRSVLSTMITGYRIIRRPDTRGSTVK